MRSDSYFSIGKTHIVCEDYARSGKIKNGLYAGMPYAILSDGCSGASDTDIGARLLVLHAETLLQNAPPKEPFEENLLIDITEDTTSRMEGLPTDCLAATVLIARWVPPNNIEVLVYGDGVVAAQDFEGNLSIIDVSYPSGAPHYLSYKLDQALEKQYQETYGGLRETCVFNQNRWSNPETGTGPLTLNYSLNDIETVMIFSDGVGSFQQWDPEGLYPTAIPVEEIVTHMFDIKVWAGPFIIRRARKFLSDFCVKHHWQHRDDFSVAAISSRGKD
jgi:hypothetical protein